MADERVLGEQLRAARQALGWTSEDVAQRLNLRASIVEAIEDGEGGAMLGEVYARSHIRTMAVMYGLSWADGMSEE